MAAPGLSGIVSSLAQRQSSRAAGVPGTVRGMELALKKYGSGKLNWAQLVEPARRLAANGFVVTYTLARSLGGNNNYLSQYPETKRIYLNDGKFYEEGNVFRQPDLAATFARLQRAGPNEFYEGQTARMIVDDVKRHNGLITLADMRGYVAKEREPVRGSYRGYEVISMPPPSSGGAVLIEMLNILEGYDLKKMDSASSERACESPLSGTLSPCFGRAAQAHCEAIATEERRWAPPPMKVRQRVLAAR